MSVLNSVVAPFLFPSVIWRAADDAVHLTFDDGPHPVATPKVLDILQSRGVRATFFVIGENVRAYPDIVRRIVQDGHTIGNHSRSHRILMFRSTSHQRDEICRASSIIEQVVGQKPRLFRPPYGYFDFRTLNLAKAEALKVVMWDIDPRDFTDSSSAQIVRRVTSNLARGSVILHHDNDRTAPIVHHYLDSVIDCVLERGYQFSSL